MIRRIAHVFTAVAVLGAAAAVVRPAAAQAPGPVRLLDVPYLPQSVALCGGAAAAMVMRYWGATGIYPEAFASLVIPEEGGIRGDDLRAALADRGWNAIAFRGDAALVKSHVAEGRPVIALIEDRPGTFHYVVVVGWPERRVVAHDPARAPFQVYDEARFVEAWSRSGHYTLLALPIAGRTADAQTPEPGWGAGSRGPCESMVDEGVRRAVGGDRAAARQVFEAAAAACPEASSPWRELAGLRVLEKDWDEAERLATRAVSLEASDGHAWRIVATSRYLRGDADGALAAWNAVDEPVLDLVNVRGLNRTRYGIALDATGLEPQRVLAAGALGRARRRLAELPSAQTIRMVYRPLAGGRAVVDATIVERPVLPTTVPALAGIGVRVLAQQELRVTIASPTGGGETWTAGWRWNTGRPAWHLAFAAPGGPGASREVTLFRTTDTFSLPAGEASETRTGGVAGLVDWASAGTRWGAGAGFERWAGRGSAALLFAEVRQVLDAGRLEARGRASVRAGAVRAIAAAGDAEWRSSVSREGVVMLARGGVEAVTGDAPLSLWPGADVGAAREPLLRAHPLLDRGRIARGVFGRTLWHGGVEARWWRPAARGLVRLAPAVFLDAAKAARTQAPFATRPHLDAGVGLRIDVPGTGVVRLDVARGLRDGRMAWSVGWSR